ncbi:MAG: response regulator [Candidatus Omnitrophica bacterium]|nr:response regulator [Candidatus Omnitrophota bacterium]
MAKILVVDDDVEFTQVIADTLKKERYEVVVAHDGQEAVEKFNEGGVDLVLLDIHMPFYSGYWFCEAVRKKPKVRRTPIIVLSAVLTDDVIETAYNLGACACLPKPFRSKELLRMLKEYVH